MKDALQRAMVSGRTLVLFTAISFLALSGCEEPGLVGSGFTDVGATVQVDTIEIEELSVHNFNHFSGGLNFISAGRFNDPLFGDMEAIGLIRPSLISLNDTIDDGADLSLQLILDQDNVYGNPFNTLQIDLRKLDQVWRGRAWNLQDPVTLSPDPPVASFSIGLHDTVQIALSDDWLQEYRSYAQNEGANRDSLYKLEFPGLALVPQNVSKILPIIAPQSTFIVRNPDGDDLTIPVLDWAYSLNRTNVPGAPAGTYKFHSTFEQILGFRADFTRESLGSVNISKVELVLYEDKEELSSSLDTLSGDVVRPEINFARLYLQSPGNVPYAIDFSSNYVSGIYSEEDGSYRFNLTSTVNANNLLFTEIPESLQFYIKLETNNGVIRSTLIHNLEAPEGKRPKLIVTSLQNDEE